MQPVHDSLVGIVLTLTLCRTDEIHQKRDRKQMGSG